MENRKSGNKENRHLWKYGKILISKLNKRISRVYGEVQEHTGRLTRLLCDTGEWRERGREDDLGVYFI